MSKSIKIPFLFLLIILIGISSCKQSLLMDTYNLQKPDDIIPLPEVLKEISGLTYVGNDKLAAVQDEKGLLFIINAKTKTIESKSKFGKKGDYEGICLVRDTFYCVESNGTVHQTSLDSTAKKHEKFKTWLTSKNDIEGLCYHEASDCLLLVCKGRSGNKRHKKGTRSIYPFDLKTKELAEAPFLELSETEIGEKLGHDMFNKFHPSGMAFSTSSDKLYIISSAGNAIAVYDKNNKLEEVHQLAEPLFIQPEGICFDENGSLFISNEGRNGQANILVFKPQ